MRTFLDNINPDELQKDDQKYLSGFQNRMIRYYFYISRGLDILNAFRNLFLGIGALYIALKIDQPLWIVVMVIVSLIILLISGYYNVHKLAKMQEWLSMRFSTHFGIKSFNYTEEQNKLLKGILKELEDARIYRENLGKDIMRGAQIPMVMPKDIELKPGMFNVGAEPK